MKQIYRGISVFVGVELFLLPIINYSQSIFKEYESVLYALILVCILFVFLIVSKVKTSSDKSSLSITALDVLFVTYLAYSLFSALFVRDFAIDYSYYFVALALSLTYLLIRFFEKNGKNIIILSIIITGILQALWAILQAQDYISGKHISFKVTGTFQNPAILGLLLSITFILLLGKILKNKSNIKIISLLIPIILLTGYALYLSDSRAAWLATIIGILCTLYKSRYTAVIRSISSTKRIIFISVILALISGILLGLYLYKPKSADGRLLIWNISLTMIADRPLLGHGSGTFSEKYMLYQADYFEEYPDSKYSMVADNNGFAFNEIIRIGVEHGVISLLFILILLSILFRTKTSYSLKAALIAFIVFSLFSYPGSVFYTQLVFVILLGFIDSNSIAIFKISPKRQYFFIPVFFLLSIIAYQALDLYNTVNKNLLFLYSYPNDKSAEKYIDSSYSLLSRNRNFMVVYFDYAKTHMSYEKYLPIALDASVVNPTSEIYCDLGVMYRNKKMYDVAFRYLNISCYMVPSRLRPQYELFNTYIEKGDRVAAKEIGENILNIPVKIENTKTLRMKADVKCFLEEFH